MGDVVLFPLGAAKVELEKIKEEPAVKAALKLTTKKTKEDNDRRTRILRDIYRMKESEGRQEAVEFIDNVRSALTQGICGNE